MPAYELTAGDYSGWKYWRATLDRRRLVIVGGQIPWGPWILVLIVLSGMGAAMLWVLWRQGPPARSAFAFTCIPIALAVGGVFLLPLLKARSEKSRGVILDYDLDRQRLALPRERLSLARDQIVEFLILEECAPPRSFMRRNRFPPAAELRVRFRNPQLKEATLLQVTGPELLADVAQTLQQAGLTCVRHLRQDPDGLEWKEQAL
ncbi:MAG: hypothetical protein JNL10_16960 [Verrucomicrobiales bacterium]|nr:hypothetical protein [Verrucomicrobiales bacterium]